MMIRNENDLRNAYLIVLAYTQFMDKAKAEGREVSNVRQTLDDLKRDIRAHLKREAEAAKGWAYIKDTNDGYIERFEMPDVDDPEAWFDENRRLTYTPCAYDCTGQAFTAWHSFKILGGRKVCYHSIEFDV